MMTEQETLFSMARDCAYTRIRGECSNQFGSMECGECTVYIGNYSQAGMQQLRLFMYGAEDEVKRGYSQIVKLEEAGDRRIARRAVFTCLSITIVITLCIMCNQRNTSVVSVPPIKQQSTDAMIKDTLIAISSEWHRQIDYSKDGEINCQDAAILFYKLYPDKENCGIESNAKISHAFNVVKVEGVWRAVEPQAYIYGNRPMSYFMRDYWGDEYDPAYNYDSWYKYGEFTK